MTGYISEVPFGLSNTSYTPTVSYNPVFFFRSIDLASADSLTVFTKDLILLQGFAVGHQNFAAFLELFTFFWGLQNWQVPFD